MRRAKTFSAVGIMGPCVRSHDWAGTSLGPAEGWPQSLCTALQITLGTAVPASLAWGRDLVCFYNDACLPFLGNTPDGLGRPFPEVWSALWETVGPIVVRAMRGEASLMDDLPLTLLRGSDPEPTRLSFSCSPVRDEAGGVGGVLCMLHEATRPGQTEADLRRSEARLASVLDALPVGVGLVDHQGNITLQNRMLGQYALVSLSAGDPKDGRRWRACTSEGKPLDQADYPSARALRGETVVPGVAGVFTYPDGREVWTRVSATPFRHGTEEELGALIVVQDIDGEKRAEERFREFAAQSMTVFWIAGVSERRLDCLNPGQETIFGTGREPLPQDISQGIEAVHPDDRGRFVEAFDSAAAGVVSIEEFRILQPDGAPRWLRSTFFPIRDEDGVIRRAGGIAQDITPHDGRFVYVVDADATSRQSLSRLLRNGGYDVRTFTSNTAFLAAAPVLVPGCVVLGTRPRDADGLAIPRELKARRIALPTIVLGDPEGDVMFGVRVLKSGAADFVALPYQADQLLTAVASAAGDLRHGAEAHNRTGSRTCIAEMSSREREVLTGILTGQTNKEMGRSIGISPRTVETHRAHVMQRLGAKTVPDVVRIAASAGFPAPRR